MRRTGDDMKMKQVYNPYLPSWEYVPESSVTGFISMAAMTNSMEKIFALMTMSAGLLHWKT